MRTSMVESLVRDIDPVVQEEIESWGRSPAATAIRARTAARQEPGPIDASSTPGRSRARLIALVDSLLAHRPEDRPTGRLVLHELIALEIAALGRAA